MVEGALVEEGGLWSDFTNVIAAQIMRKMLSLVEYKGLGRQDAWYTASLPLAHQYRLTDRNRIPSFLIFILIKPM